MHLLKLLPKARSVGVAALAAGAWGSSLSVAAQPQGPEATVHAYRLYTGADGNSHVEEGRLPLKARIPIAAVSFAITPAHAPPVWHNDPEPQYVVTMTGTLRFTTRTHESFTLRPGDVLLAEDKTGSGHGWTLVGDDPWTRTYAILPKSYDSRFLADRSPPHGEK